MAANGPPPHYLLNEDECFFPLEGRVEFFRDNAWTEVPMGSAVFIPRGVVHTFRNTGDKPLKMLIHTTPSGLETLFERCAEESAKPNPLDMSADLLNRQFLLSRTNGISFHRIHRSRVLARQGRVEEDG